MAKGTKTGGRVAGTPNRATQEAREAIATFVQGNAHRLQEWLDVIAVDNPEKAFNLFQSVIEYHVPKLARTELVGDPEKPLKLQFGWEDASKASGNPLSAKTDIPALPPEPEAQ